MKLFQNSPKVVNNIKAKGPGKEAEQVSLICDKSQFYFSSSRRTPIDALQYKPQSIFNVIFYYSKFYTPSLRFFDLIHSFKSQTEKSSTTANTSLKDK